tara:strand:- start:61669 stop:61908 length:240 start_codon:yes stop_codon:yes gene_type:complete
VLVLVGIVISNSSSMNKVERDLSVFPDGFMPAINVILNADRDLYQARVAELQYVNGSQSDIVKYKESFEENAQQALDRF